MMEPLQTQTHPGSSIVYTIQAGDLETYTNQTEIPYQGSAENPAYVPGYVASTTPPREPNPVLSFQTTHVNPYTSIADRTNVYAGGHQHY